jgi:hypothetical protein
MTPDAARKVLSTYLPPAVLLVGPGSWDLASLLAEMHGPGEVVRPLDADSARRIRDSAQYQPASGQRLFVVGLDGAGRSAQNILLKTIEEPPRWVRFILAGTRLPLDTIASRCEVYALGADAAPRSVDEQSKVLVGGAIKAARSGSLMLLSRAIRDWEPDHTRVLWAWALEAGAERWEAFSPDFAPGVTPDQATALIEELSALGGSRLAPQVALTRVFCPG